MIHWRNPFVAGPKEHVRTDQEILDLRRQRLEAALRQPKPVPPPPSTRWKKDDQKIDLNKIKQDITPDQLLEALGGMTRQVICDPAANPLGDDDGDGFTNLQELAQGFLRKHTKCLRCVVPARRATSAFYAVLIHRLAVFS